MVTSPWNGDVLSVTRRLIPVSLASTPGAATVSGVSNGVEPASSVTTGGPVSVVGTTVMVTVAVDVRWKRSVIV